MYWSSTIVTDSYWLCFVLIITDYLTHWFEHWFIILYADDSTDEHWNYRNLETSKTLNYGNTSKNMDHWNYRMLLLCSNCRIVLYYFMLCCIILCRTTMYIYKIISHMLCICYGCTTCITCTYSTSTPEEKSHAMSTILRFISCTR